MTDPTDHPKVAPADVAASVAVAVPVAAASVAAVVVPAADASKQETIRAPSFGGALIVIYSVILFGKIQDHYSRMFGYEFLHVSLLYTPALLTFVYGVSTSHLPVVVYTALVVEVVCPVVEII